MLPLVLVACSGPADDDGRRPHAPVPTSPSPVLLTGPLVEQPSAFAPAVRRVSFTFDREVRLAGAATDGTHTIAIDVSSAEPTFPLVGLYAERTWTVTLTATASDGSALELEPFSFTTDPLPPVWPTLELHRSDPRAEPGFTLFPIISLDDTTALVAVDRQGEIAWWWSKRDGDTFYECLPTATGVVFLYDDDRIHEIDWEGNIVRTVTTQRTNLPIMHHELSVLPDGTWLTLSMYGVHFGNYAQSYDDPTDFAEDDVTADRIVQIDPATGDVPVDFRLHTVLDRYRIGYDSLENSVFGRDWTHANSVSVDETGDAWIVSLRHQDAVVAVDRTSGTLRWILGTPANWGPPYRPFLLAGDATVEWPYHQHAAKWLGNGDVLLFDNHNWGTSPWSGEPALDDAEVHSRIVLYHIDDEAMTVTQTLSLEPDPYLFSSGMGDVDLLPGGTILATFANVNYRAGLTYPSYGRGRHGFEIVEFDPATGDRVWDLEGYAGAGSPEPTWRTYRAERFSSLGPGSVPPP